MTVAANTTRYKLFSLASTITSKHKEETEAFINNCPTPNTHYTTHTMSEPLTDTGESTSFQIQSDAGNVATIESFAMTPKECGTA